MTICLLVPMSSLSRLSARSLFPIQSSSGCLSSFLLFPPHRMSGELVKTARADWSSVKPLQSISVSSRLPPRIGCRMTCPAGCLSLTACPSASRRPRLACLPLSHPFRSSVSTIAPSCVSCLCSLLACLSRFDASLRHAYPSGMSVSSHPLIRSSAHPLIRFARPPRPAYPPRLSCRRAGRHHLAFISSCVSPAASAFRLSSSRCAYRYTECCGDGDRRMWGIRASVP